MGRGDTYSECLGEEKEPLQRWLLCENLFCTRRNTHNTKMCTRPPLAQAANISRVREQGFAASYLQEVPALAVDVDEVVVHRDELLGLPDEEGRAVQLRLVRGEAELPLYTQHVDAPWGGRDKGLLPLPALEGDSAPAPAVQGRRGTGETPPQRDPHRESQLKRLGAC